MEPASTADAAIGWAIIAAGALACWYGPKLVLGPLLRDHEEHRVQRLREAERIEDELDDLARLELLAMVEQEDRDRDGRRPG